MAVFMIGSLVVRKELHVGPTDGRFTTPQQPVGLLQNSRSTNQVTRRPRRAARKSRTTRDDPSLNHLVRAQQQRLRNRETECLRSLEVDGELVLGRKLDRKVARRCTFAKPVDVRRRAA